MTPVLWVRGSSDPLPPQAARRSSPASPAAAFSGLRRSATPPGGGSEDPRTQRPKADSYSGSAIQRLPELCAALSRPRLKPFDACG